MKKLFILFVLCGSFSSVFAIAGFGFQGGLDLTTEISGVENDPLTFTASCFEVVNTALTGGLQPTFSRDAVEGLFALGGKFYIDVLPIIDIEATVNIAGNTYDFMAIYPGAIDAASIASGDFLDTLDQGFAYGRLSGDLTIRKTLLSLPPLVKILKLYIGAGPTFAWQTPVIDTEIFNTALEDAVSNESIGQDALISALEDQIEYEATVGGHVLVGAQVKPPIIPLYINVDFKQYFGLPEVDGGNASASVLCFGAGIGF